MIMITEIIGKRGMQNEFSPFIYLVDYNIEIITSTNVRVRNEWVNKPISFKNPVTFV